MEAAFSRISPVNINGINTNRLMVVLKTTGCEYAKKKHGGCTVCGFIKNADNNISQGDIINQFEQSLTMHNLDNVGEIDLLTLGSFLNDNEVKPQTRKALLERVANIPHIKRISIESRADYVTLEKLVECKKILKDKILDFGIGLESANDYIRNSVINKSLSKEDFEKTVKTLKEAECTLLVYLLIKPPGLTENEAIIDAVESAKYVFSVAQKYSVTARVAFEPVFISEDSKLEKLYLQSKYRMLNLWSVVDVILKTYEYGCIFIGLSDENLSKERMPNSCPKCANDIRREIEYFNKTQDVSGLKKLNCECKVVKDKEKEVLV
jgi:hypothetical protein